MDGWTDVAARMKTKSDGKVIVQADLEIVSATGKTKKAERKAIVERAMSSGVFIHPTRRPLERTHVQVMVSNILRLKIAKSGWGPACDEHLLNMIQTEKGPSKRLKTAATDESAEAQNSDGSSLSSEDVDMRTWREMYVDAKKSLAEVEDLMFETEKQYKEVQCENMVLRRKNKELQAELDRLRAERD